jgi:hypothetical protein
MSAVLVDGEIEFHFEKSGLFRVIHVDGVVGSIAPGNHLIRMSVYSERAPVPQVMVHRITNGTLGGEVTEKRVSRSGVYREVDADLVINVDTAIAIRGWLDDRIKDVENARALAASRSSDASESEA